MPQIIMPADLGAELSEAARWYAGEPEMEAFSDHVRAGRRWSERRPRELLRWADRHSIAIFGMRRFLTVLLCGFSGADRWELWRAAKAELRRARAATLLMLALPGSAYLYQGEELGLQEVGELPAANLQDPAYFRSKGAEKGRDGCRVPIPWTVEGLSFGFGPGGSHLVQPKWFGAYSVEAQHDDQESTLSLYRKALAVRPGNIAQLAPRLGIVKEHMMARHPQAIHRDEWLDSAQVRQQFRSICDRIEHFPWQFDRRRTPSDQASDVGKHVGKQDVVAAKDVALADPPTVERGKMAGGDVVDMRQVEPCFYEGRHASRRSLDNDPASRRRPHIARTDWR